MDVWMIYYRFSLDARGNLLVGMQERLDWAQDAQGDGEHLNGTMSREGSDAASPDGCKVVQS